MLHTVRPRVFVSSVVEGFQEYRAAARLAIEAAGGEPILVNEDFPALNLSSRNACLDAVDSSDIYIAIIGDRGGWSTPSGKLVVEEEYYQARAKKLLILVFLQNVDRDAEGQRLADELSDYVDGLFRVTFQTTTDLQAEVERALKPLISSTRKSAMDKERVRRSLEAPYTIPNQTSLRFVFGPERNEEVIDPLELGTQEFIDRIYEIGHDRKVHLFSYQHPKNENVRGHSLVIQQATSHQRSDATEEVRLEITESGQIVIDMNVTGRVRRGKQHSLIDSMVVAHEDIKAVLTTCFYFIASLYDEIDRFKRHQHFFYNVVLVGLGYRTLMENPVDQSSFGMNSSGNDQPVIAFEEPRLANRADLQTPAKEIERVLTLLSRMVKR